jgi:hypothetical protein
MVFTAVTAVATIVYVKYAKKQWAAIREATRQNVLARALFEYRSLEMFCAVKMLWTFYHDHRNTDVGAAYERQRLADEARIRELPLAAQAEAERATLHYQRRLVSHFYQFLAGQYELGVLPKDVLFTFWHRPDLEIIPRVLLPLETVSALNFTRSRRPKEIMRRLYEDSPSDTYQIPGDEDAEIQVAAGTTSK